jgi:hypothetical protein
MKNLMLLFFLLPSLGWSAGWRDVEETNRKTPALGPTTKAYSTPVTIATDQIPLPVSATLDTTGLATDTAQATGNATLAGIKTGTDKIPSSPSQEHTASNSPNSCRLSDGTSFISTLPVSIASMPTTAVTGTFWQSTQPVSGSVSVSNFPASQAVTGTFWQATQPVSGTFYQATQPVSIASMPSTPVTGTFWQATQPVSGTFYQATQPVSIASMPSTPVTGTFWQTTQPVSGTVTANAGSGTMAVSGTFWQATQPVSGTVTANAGTGTMTVAQATTGGNPCLNPASTLVSITGATSTTNATQIVALSGSTKIYICSMTIIGVSGTSPTFSLVQGTGSNCVTGQTTVVQSWATTAGTLYAFANPVSVGTAGAALCYKDGGTSPVQNYQINYVQQ